MAKKAPIRVALDLETTGLHAEYDAILEVAAIKFQGDSIIERFETFVTPGRPIPYRVQRLTGIKPELLAGAPAFDAIAKQLQSFLGDYPIVGHSIPFDVGFLRRRGLARSNPLIDTFELATVLLPSLSSYNLGQVATFLGVEVPQDRHRAMVDTVLAMNVFLALYERLQAVDLAMLKDLASLDAPRTWPLLGFLRQELRERQEQDGLQGSLSRGSLGDRLYAQLGMDPRVLSFAIARQQDAQASLDGNGTTPRAENAVPAQVIEREQSNEQEATEWSGQRIIRGNRAAQKAVEEALEQEMPLLMEVTIGGNDYSPALVAALEWMSATAAEGDAPRRLVIATSGPQQARRLIETILPRLQGEAGSQHAVAYLAEHTGYLCTHRWFSAALRRTSGQLTPEQARGLAKIGLWAQQTLTGERGELTLLPQEASAWERVSSGFERIPAGDKQSVYDRCNYRRNGYCFISLAEERVKHARIVVTTHAALFDDLSRPHSLLSGINHRLILDADLLEEENARWSTVEFELPHIVSLLNTIGTELEGNRYQGLLALAAPSLRENGPGGLSTTQTVAKAELDARMISWFQSLRSARNAVEKLFRCFTQLLEEFQLQGVNGNGQEKGKSEAARRHQGGGRGNERSDHPLRLNSQVSRLSGWAETERAWQQLAQRLQTVIDMVRVAENTLLATQRNRHRRDSESGEVTMLTSEFATVVQQLVEQRQLGQQALSLEGDDTVYWLRLPPPTPFAQQSVAQRTTGGQGAGSSPEATPVLYAQLVQTSSLLKRLHLLEDSSTIFVGAALSVDNSFAFYRKRFGVEDDSVPAVSVTTERHEQTLLYIPDDVPEPNTPQYQRHLDEALVQLASSLEGQLMVLFTSHAALRSSYAAIKPVLETRGILVLGQGLDGSPRQLWHIAQEQPRVVLLGTGGFWEGVDEMHSSPSCLVVTRLPMPALNDPPLAARAEHYSDQLHQFTVPLAALRLRRMLNRAMWSDTRRNAVVMFDRRVISKDYGSVVLHSLPRTTNVQASASDVSERVMDWLTSTDARQ